MTRKHEPYAYVVAECVCGWSSSPHPDLRTGREAAARHRREKKELEDAGFTDLCPSCGDGYFDLQSHLLEECREVPR